jgi:amino acid adenylation domain-containing protein
MVGSPIANRSRRQVESLIGVFINTVVLRTDLSGNPPFSRLLGRVKETALGAYANQDAPLERLVEELVPSRDARRPSLFQVMFALQNAPRLEARLGNLSIVPLPLESTSAKFELTVSMLETDEGMTAVWEYDSGLFDEQTIQRMIGHYDRLLAAIVLNPAQRISRLEMLSREEVEQLLALSVPAGPVEKGRGLIHRLLEVQVERTPDAVALLSGEEHVTYNEVNERSNKVGHYLVAQGIGPESRVGIWIERSPSLVIALVGVLKAGAAYVPLDPAYPEHRVSYVVGDAGIAVLLTEHQLSSSAPGLNIKTIGIDTDWAAIDLESGCDLQVPQVTGNLAYVIYTSGSTGKPKGVAISHEDVIRLFGSTKRSYGFDEKDVWTLFHSSAFDFSVWEIWGALLFGGRLVIVPYLLTRTPQAFYELVCDERVTVLNQTPSSFRQFIQVEQSACHSPSLALKNVIFGGEALDPASLRPWFERHPGHVPRLINMYGITETTVHVTYRPLTVADSAGSRASLIGQPIPDLTLFIAGPDTSLVPLEVPGEIHVGGAGLARGYLNNPGLTAERFIPDPFSSTGGGRLYKAGDLSRLMPDGDREYLGRVDQQVKIRGFRIELGEIEASLSCHPLVKRAVVTTTSDAAGETRLVAYLITEPENVPQVSDLRAYLKDRLPDYMIPSWFVYVDTFPLTTNGKLDRRALPDPSEALKPNREQVAPRDILELEIARIWEETLEMGPVGVTEDFFDLGGHSLMAVRLTARLRARLNVDIPLSALIQGGSVESLACMLRAKQQLRPDSPLVPIQTRGQCAPLFCVHPIGGNVLCYVELSRHLGKDHPFYGLQSRGLHIPIHRDISVEEMAAEYIEAIQAIQPAGPYRLGGWSFGGVVAAEMARQLEEQGNQIELLVLIDSRAPSLDSDDIYSRSEEDAMELVSAFLADLSGLAGTELAGKELLEVSPATMGLSVEELFGRILASAREQQAVPPSADVSQIVRLFEIYRSNLHAARRYKPSLKWLPGQTVLVGSANSDEANGQLLTLGWEEFASGPLIFRSVQATHYSMLRKPEVAVLASILREFI